MTANERLAATLRNPEFQRAAQQLQRDSVQAQESRAAGSTVSPTPSPTVQKERYTGWERGRVKEERQAVRPPPSRDAAAQQQQQATPQPTAQQPTQGQQPQVSPKQQQQEASPAAQKAQELRSPQPQQAQPQRQAEREPSR